MAITAVTAAGTTATSTTANATITPAIPTGTTTDDVMVAVVTALGSASDIVSTPTGWTKVTFLPGNANSMSLTIYAKIALSSNTAPGFTIGAGNNGGSCGLMSYRGVYVAGGITGIWDTAGVSTTNMPNTSASLPTVTTATDGAWRLDMFQDKAAAAFLTPSATSTERFDVGNGGTVSTRTAAGLQDNVVTVAGADDRVVTLSVNQNIVYCRALLPIVGSTFPLPHKINRLHLRRR